MPSSRTATPSLADAAAGRGRRHLEPAPRGAAARAAARPAHRAAARQPRHAPAQARRRAATTRSCWPPPGLMRLGLGDRIRARFDAERDAAVRRPGRARHRDARRRRRADRAPGAADRPADAGSRSPPSARCRARSAAAAACRWPRMPPGAATRCELRAAVGHPARRAGAAAARARAPATAADERRRRGARHARRAGAARGRRRRLSGRRRNGSAPAPTRRERGAAPRVLVTRPAAQAGAVGRAAARARRRRRGAAADRDRAAGRRRAAATPRGPALARAGWSSSSAPTRCCASSPRGRPALAWPAGALAGAPGPRHRRGAARGRRAGGGIVAPAADAAQFDSEALWAQPAAAATGTARASWSCAATAAATGSPSASPRPAPRSTPSPPTAASRRRFDGATRTRARRRARRRRRHAWLFSSSEAIDNLERAGRRRAAGAAARLATHPRIAARARQAGFGDVVEARARARRGGRLHTIDRNRERRSLACRRASRPSPSRPLLPRPSPRACRRRACAHAAWLSLASCCSRCSRSSRSSSPGAPTSACAAASASSSSASRTARARPPRRAARAPGAGGRARRRGQGGAARGARRRGRGAARPARGPDPVALALARREPAGRQSRRRMRAALQQAALTGSAEPLVATLKQTDERLARYNQPRLEPVRRADRARPRPRQGRRASPTSASLGDQARRGGAHGRRAAAAVGGRAAPRSRRAAPRPRGAAPPSALGVGERRRRLAVARVGQAGPLRSSTASGRRSARWCASPASTIPRRCWWRPTRRSSCART